MLLFHLGQGWPEMRLRYVGVMAIELRKHSKVRLHTSFATLLGLNVLTFQGMQQSCSLNFVPCTK